MSQTVARGLLILNALAEDGPSSPQLLAESLEINRTIVHRILQSLLEGGFVDKGGGVYRLSLELPRIAQSVEQKLRKAALIEITTLGEKIGLPVFIFIRDAEEAIALVSHVPQIHNYIRAIPQIGFSDNLSHSAAGLTLLAFGPSKERENILRMSLRPKTSTEQLHKTIQNGFADTGLNIDTNWDEVAVPIFHEETVSACISVILSNRQSVDIPSLVSDMKRSSRQISQNLLIDQ